MRVHQAAIAHSMSKGPITLGHRHAARDDATIDAFQGLNIHHVKLTGYDKARLTRKQ